MFKIIWLKNTSENERLSRINTFSDISSSRKMSRQNSTISYNELSWQQFCQVGTDDLFSKIQILDVRTSAVEVVAIGGQRRRCVEDWRTGGLLSSHKSIGTFKLNEIIEIRDSIVRNVYLHSSFGVLSPIASAEAAFRPKLSSAADPSAPTTPTTPQKRKTSFVPPFFSRMISRQD